MGKEKLNEYEIIKVVAILLVVFAHVSRMYTSDGIIDTLRDSITLNYLTQYIYSFHMPLFVFVSGAIYYYVRKKLNKYDNINKFVVSKSKRLMIPYIVFGLFYVAPIMIGLNLTKSSTIGYISKGIILSLDSRHLWYVFMLFNVFIILRIFEKYIDKAPTLIPIVIFIFLYSISGRLPAILQISNTAKYLVFFYMGYLFQNKKEIIFDKLKFNKLSCISFFLLNIITLIGSIYMENIKVPGLIIGLTEFSSAVFGILFIYGVITLLSKTTIEENKIYKSIEKNSFGIYLFHPMLIYIMFYFLGPKDIHPYILTLLVFVVSLLISNILTEIVRLAHLDIIIGEKRKVRRNKNISIVQ